MDVAIHDSVTTTPGVFEAGGPRTGLAGFFLSGVLLSFLGVILPVWRYHLTADYVGAGNYFLAMNVGILAALGIARVAGRPRLRIILSLACVLACSALVFLALLPVSVNDWWRIAGILVLGCGAGLLNVGLFRAIWPLYRHDAAATVNLAGAMFGAGCFVMALLAAGTFYVYTVTSILIFVALLPGFFIPIYARSRFTADEQAHDASWQQAVAGFKNPAAVLFALLLFFQFGNEWAIAGWLPLFLIQRIGISPESSLMMLATYWLALLVGRIAAVSILPLVSRGKLLMGSVVAALFGCTILISTNNRFGAVTGILLTGWGFAAVYPLVIEKIGDRFPDFHPGFFNGILSLALTGGMLAPWSVGLFTSHWGIRVAMGLPLLGTVMVFVLLIVIWAEAKLRVS